MKPMKYFSRRGGKIWQIILGTITFIGFAMGGFAVSQFLITTYNNSPIVSQINNSCGSVIPIPQNNAILIQHFSY